MPTVILPCEVCGSNRWKTIKKGERWKCRECKTYRPPRLLGDFEPAPAPVPVVRKGWLRRLLKGRTN